MFFASCAPHSRNREPYAYNIVLAQDRTTGGGPAAAAVALDAAGNHVASAARSGFRSKSAARGCAKELAKRSRRLRNKSNTIPIED